MTTSLSPADMVSNGIHAFRNGDRLAAFETLVAALCHDQHNELAWLWLSAVVTGQAEQKYCLERVLELNPQHVAARKGLNSFDTSLASQAPFQLKPIAAGPTRCSAPGCNRVLKQAGYTLCYEHWKATRQPPIASKPAPTPAPAVRERRPARLRTTDGHFVRSKAELLIDNWLYMAGVVHAYERQLPISEAVYCDFYLPRGNLYLEYWGMDHDPAYAARRQEKQVLYTRYGFALIELTDEHVRNLDDHLPKLMLQHGMSLV